jgi:hypothetical protein
VQRRLDVHHVVKRSQGGSDVDLDLLVALCRWCHDQTDAPYARGRLVVTALGAGQFTFEVVARVGPVTPLPGFQRLPMSAKIQPFNNNRGGWCIGCGPDHHEQPERHTMTTARPRTARATHDDHRETTTSGCEAPQRDVVAESAML